MRELLRLRRLPIRCLDLAQGLTIAEVAAVVMTLTVAVPAVAVPLNVTVALPFEQVGRCVAPAGLAVRAHVTVIVPA